MNAHRLVFSTLAAVLGVLVFASAPALAAAPESPETGSASAVTANTATLEGGVLNPNAAGEPGEYEYLYKASASECEGESVTPVPEGIAAGLKKEAVPPVKLTGLKAAQAYTFCLVERNAANPEERSPASAPVTFTTLTAQPAIEGEYVSFVESSAAILNAQTDPDGEATTYYFQYGTNESYSQSTPETALPQSGTANFRITGLKPATTYHYRVVTTNSLSPGGGTLGPDKTFTTPAVLGSEPAQNCSNEQRRAEQPYALALPDCRAYEMVSPLETNGADATDSFVYPARAAVSGEALMYSSDFTFANPTGETIENEFVSRRGPEGWSTQSVTPLHDPRLTQTETSFPVRALTPELTEGIANTNAALTPEAPAGNTTNLYLDNFANNSYQYIGSNENKYPQGTSTDLSHVVFGEYGGVSEWVNGNVIPVSVTNSGEQMSASVGAAAPNPSYVAARAAWHAVSADGSTVYFTSPHAIEENFQAVVGQLYVRVNAEQPQSPLASPEVNGTGTLTEGSNTVTSLVAAAADVESSAGSTTIYILHMTVGKFFSGQPVSGPGIAPGTTITGVSGDSFTLSTPSTASIPPGTMISSNGPMPFTVGQKIGGDGIPSGTTITGVAAGSLTLSAPAVSSGSGVALDAGGECTVASDACTIEVSSSQRLLSNPAGVQTAWYRGASADGSRVFFMSNAELTEDAYTGPAGNAANLYEYNLERPEGERLKDLTVDKTDTDGAGVLGVVQISEDGSYVYFVATGGLTEGATVGQANLYVSHGNGLPTFIATLAASDSGDWFGSSAYLGEGSPGQNTAVVTPSGNRLAFLSERSLTGYDNEQAEGGECGGTGRCQEVYLYNAETKEKGLVCASCDPSGARPVGQSSFATQAYHPYELYRPRNLIEDGTLFFDSADALVPHASDGRRNVYEYEDGHIYPISDVAGGYESFFLDASANGDNVFFGTADQLLPQATSNNVVVYDARIGGGFPITTSPPPCDNGDSCKSPEAPQSAVFGAPGSANFSGPGNIEPAATVKPTVKTKGKTTKCKKDYEKRKGKCIRKPSSKKKKKTKKSSDRKGSK